MKYSDVQQGYTNLWAKMSIRPERRADAEFIAKKLYASRATYQRVSSKVGCPWWFVAIIHQLESSGNFKTHLHNGDPLTARTKKYPPGRPKSGTPPFSWEESAIDALSVDPHDMRKVSDWSIPRALFELEKYNGLGYYGKINSPYLWSYSNLYTSGKWKEVKVNGKWVSVYDPNLVSAQCGAAVILRAMYQLELLEKDPMKELTELLSQFSKIVPTLVVAATGGAPLLALRAIAEAMNDDTPNDASAEQVKSNLEKLAIGDLVAVLSAAEQVVRRLTNVGVDDTSPEIPAPVTVPAAPETTVSPIDELLGFKGWKTIAGLAVGVITWILSVLGVIEPTFAEIGYGIAVFIGGVGVKAWMDRLSINTKK